MLGITDPWTQFQSVSGLILSLNTYRKRLEPDQIHRISDYNDYFKVIE